jgi:hypothetical protein
VTLSHSSSKPCGAHVVLPRPIQLRVSTEFSRYKIPPEFLLPYFRKLPSELALNFTDLVRIPTREVLRNSAEFRCIA